VLLSDAFSRTTVSASTSLGARPARMSNFQGGHTINMDAKGRVAIPTKVREDLMALCHGRIIVTAHNEEPCLLIYPENEWEVLRPKIEVLPNMSRAVRRLQRLILGHATPFELDSTGRVLLPPPLRDHAKLEKKLRLIGQGKKLELWSEELWNAWLEESGDDDDLPQAMMELAL